MGLHYEAVDYNDPLTLLLAAEDEDAECDVLHTMYDAGLSRAKTFERERTEGDLLGASPYELACQDSLH